MKPDLAHHRAHGGKAHSGGVLGFGAAWAMAVGGMIGGGIFATLGVVIAAAGRDAWTAFLLAGLVALATGHSYAQLTVACGKAGGLYEYLTEGGRAKLAKWAAWVLIAGYTLTVSVYAYTFGAYTAHALDGPAWLPQALAAAAIIIIAGVNLMGAGEASIVEIVVVWGKLIVLAGLAAFGIAEWSPDRLAIDGAPPGWLGAIVGAASIFMAYEGFQLLAYDYDQMRERETMLPRVMPAAILSTIAVYIAVAIGVAMIVGAQNVVDQKEIALATAGQKVGGRAGLIVVTIAAAFSTASAINATLFSTARLAKQVAQDGAMPAVFAKNDEEGVPWAGIMLIAALALVLALLGGLDALVQGASFVFLAAFAAVNLIAWRRGITHRWIALAGLCGALLSATVLALHVTGVV